jgi:5-formyltetrahydrofolate cyclo-ligase
MTKKEIRKIELEKRLHLSSGDLFHKTALIAGQFDKLNFSPVNYLLSYYPLKERNEFDVSICEKKIKEKYSHAKIAWPKMILNTPNMEAHLTASNKLFIKNKFNILEPLNGDSVLPTLIDMVFVPQISFNRAGYRVGYGKGFYDRYLAECRTDVVKIGFSFFDPVDEIDDINEFDVPLNLCITPTCIYEF